MLQELVIENAFPTSSEGYWTGHPGVMALQLHVSSLSSPTSLFCRIFLPASALSAPSGSMFPRQVASETQLQIPSLVGWNAGATVRPYFFYPYFRLWSS